MDADTEADLGPLPYPHNPSDKSAWPAGSWREEPDVLTWVDAATGLNCAILRMPFSGGLNGYVAVPLTSKLDGVGYSDEIGEGRLDGLVRCHGGLTYSSRSKDGIWWFGFDTSHYQDYSPARAADRWNDGYYRDIDYVKRECEKLAADIVKLDESIRHRS